MIKIGNDFSNLLELNLLPGIDLPRGYWVITIYYSTRDYQDNLHDKYAGNFNVGPQSTNFNALFGKDVYRIFFKVHRHNSFPGTPNLYLTYTLRVDHILMLNFIYKLAGIKLEI